MPRIHGYSWLLVSIAAALSVVASVVIGAVPREAEHREVREMERHAEGVGKMVATRYGSELLRGDRIAITRTDELMRTIDHLLYFVIVDANDTVVSSLNMNGADKLGYDKSGTQESDSEGGLAIKTTLPVSLGPEGGIIYIGLSKAEVLKTVRKSRNQSLAFGLVLLLLASGIVVTVWRTSLVERRVSDLKKKQKDLHKLKNSLESEVENHRLAEETLRESEQRYRYLLENSMASTFKDLEDLNKDLERRKGELEIEVSEKTKAQSTLRNYSDRLEALNDIGRSMLEGKSLEEIANGALEHLSDLIAFDRASIVEFDRWIGEGRLIGIKARETEKEKEVGSRMPLSFYNYAEIEGHQAHYVADIRELEEPADVESQLQEIGILSYCSLSLALEDEIVGTLNLGSTSAGAFDDEQVRAARDFADLISIAIRQSRYNDERDRYEMELISSKDRAEEMARLKSAFLTNMSHEIRTPLSGIIGFAQVLHEEVSEVHREFIGLIQTSAKRLLDTINSVLDLAKLESEQVDVAKNPIDLQESVKETVRLLQPLADKKGLKLQIADKQEPVICGLDATCLEQIVNNLVGNAIKFTAEGHVQVRVAADDYQGYLHVEDTGVGISSEFVPRLFDEFRQEEMDANRQHEGSGLGLAITKRLVEGMNGEIEVISEKGKGSTFNVSFPLYSAWSSLDSTEGIGSVLVVSPETGFKVDNLELHGEVVEVNSALDLQDALKKARQRKFDLLIVDTAGFDAEKEASGLHAIRDIPEYSNVAFIAVASEALTDFEQHYLQKEFDSIDVDPAGIGSYLSALFLRLSNRQSMETRDRQPVGKKARRGAKETKLSPSKKA